MTVLSLSSKKSSSTVSSSLFLLWPFLLPPRPPPPIISQPLPATAPARSRNTWRRSAAAPLASPVSPMMTHPRLCEHTWPRVKGVVAVVWPHPRFAIIVNITATATATATHCSICSRRHSCVALDVHFFVFLCTKMWVNAKKCGSRHKKVEIFRYEHPTIPQKKNLLKLGI